MSNPIGDPRKAGEEGPAGDQREAGEEGVAGDPRPAGEESGTATSEAPAKSATKAEWVDYAVSQGADRDEAEASTKDQLIADHG